MAIAENLPSSAAEARSLGVTLYCTGVPCKKGHVGPRYTSDQACVECKASSRAARHAADPTVRKRSARAYASTHKAANLAYGKAWRQKHRERVNALARARRAADPTKGADAGRRWRAKNVARVRARNNARRGRALGAKTGDHRAYVALISWARSTRKIRCYWCGCATAPTNRELDHVIPLARGGSDTVANLCVSCVECNRRKHAKLPEDFAGQSELRLA